MTVVSLHRRLDAPPAAVRPLIEDVEEFMKAGRFDEVHLDDDTLYLANVIGFARIELTLAIFEDETSVLAYEQVDGIFDDMVTRYTLEADNDGSRVGATTEFTLGGVAGSVLDGTLIKRQRRREITAQFDYLETELGAENQ